MSAAFDPASPLRPTGNLRRRELVSRFASGGATAAALLALVVLAWVVYTVFRRGAGAVTWTFLTKPPSQTGIGGGMGPEIAGSLVIVSLATAIAMPLGVLTALYVTEFAGHRAASVIRSVLDLMQGLPSIIIGVMFFALVVAGSGDSGYAAAFALAVVELPLIARASQEVILLVPTNLREASDALGVSKWRTIRGVILPGAMAGIVTGTILAVARAAGETAPLILLTGINNPYAFNWNPFSHPGLPTIPTEIFSLAEQPDPISQQQAWGLALVLLTFILLANFVARILLARSNRKSAR